MKTLALNAKLGIPLLGFGTWQLTSADCYEAVKYALKIGYTHIDAAPKYKNQISVGKAIQESKSNRTDLFIVSKAWWTDLHYDDLIKSCQHSLSELKTDYLDLFLVHWPNKEVPIQETLSAMQELKKQKLIKHIGVSNFTINHLKEAIATGIEIVNNQVELHPSFKQTDLVKFCQNTKISVTAYSPNGQGQDLSLPLITNLASKYKKTPSQIILNWLAYKGIVSIPRSSNSQHILENYQALDFDLTEGDLKKVNQLEDKERLLNRDYADFDY